MIRTLKANSWHRKLANFDAPWYKRIGTEDDVDFCYYCRRVLVGGIKWATAAIVMTFFASMLILLVSNFFWWFWLMFKVGALVKPTLGALIVLLLASFTLAGFLGSKLVSSYEQWRNNSLVKPSSDTFFGLLSEKVKNKMCFKIKFEE